jgi:nucleotide-binding universal stress UspA family protein
MFRAILVPIDIAHASSWRRVLPEAVELARAGRGTLTVMTVVRDIKAMFEGVYLSFQLEQMIEDARADLARIVSEVPHNGVEVKQEVRFGSIRHEILAAARAGTADLIVMASHRPEAMDYLIGPNAAHVAQHAPCSVLVLRKFDG